MYLDRLGYTSWAVTVDANGSDRYKTVADPFAYFIFLSGIEVGGITASDLIDMPPQVFARWSQFAQLNVRNRDDPTKWIPFTCNRIALQTGSDRKGAALAKAWLDKAPNCPAA
jgi:hypothetical protein